MSELSVGDKVLTITSTGEPVYSDVLLFLDQNRTETLEFFSLRSSSGTVINMTPSHLLYTIRPMPLDFDEHVNGIPSALLSKDFLYGNLTTAEFLIMAEVTFAKDVQTGDYILAFNEDKSAFTVEKIVAMDAYMSEGVYAPLTEMGTIVVDNMLASSYAVIENQELAHIAFGPVRFAHNLRSGVSHLWTRLSRFVNMDFNGTTTNNGFASVGNEVRKIVDPKKTHDQGVYWYASLLYSSTRHVLPSRLLYQF